MIAAGLALVTAGLVVGGTAQLVVAIGGEATLVLGVGNWAVVTFWRLRRGMYLDLPAHPVWAVLGLVSLSMMVADVVAARRSGATLVIPSAAGLILLPDLVRWRVARRAQSKPPRRRG